MEYVDGETLASLLRRIGQPPGAKGLELARQLCAGLGAAHARGVLHRDLKPANIMIDGGGHVRILDFGLAVTATADVREVAGTPAYMSPEQRAGERVTIQSDLYALGRVLTELLPADVRGGLAGVIQACLAADPSRRPGSAAVVAASIPSAPLPLSQGDIPTAVTTAAAPATGALRPAVAWLLLAAALGGSVGIASQAHRITVAPSELPRPPAVLAERAREIAAASGRSAPPVDRAFWWWAAGGETQIQFSYRESPRLIVPANLFRVVHAYDPPPDFAGSVMVTLNADGTPSTATEAFRDVWSTGRTRLGELFYWMAVLVGFTACAILAQRNLRAGEGDRKGARRLSLIVYSGCGLAAGLRAHHVPSVVDEVAWLLAMSGWAIVWGLFSWLAYVSSEPYVRRWWPHVIVPWVRLLAGRGRDPLVGRQVLLGIVMGVLAAALLLLRVQIPGQHPPPALRGYALESLASPAAFGSLFLFTLCIGLLTSVIALAFFVVVRLIVRRTVIAVVLLVAFSVPVFAAAWSPADVLAGVIFASLGLTVLLRIGVVAHVSMLMVEYSLTRMPLTLDGDAWYFGWSLLLLLAVAAFSVYGFLAALGGQPAFGVLERTAAN